MTSASKVKYAIAMIAGLAATGTAGAADLLPPPPPLPEPPAIHVGGGFYLRGYIGMTNQSVDHLDNALFVPADTITWPGEPGFDSSPLFGGGVGYTFNPWFRVDGTVEYRGRANFHALDIYDTGSNATIDGSNEYGGSKSEWLMLANAYLDLGTWHGITPYVGAGIGASRNTIHNFTDVNTPNNGVAYGGTESKWDLAWALHAGMGYQVTDRLTIDLAYRYTDLGDAMSGDLTDYLGGNAVYNPMHFKDLTSHDVMLGIRWNFDAPVVAELPPMPGVYKH